MAENAYVFFHPQYGGLRVVNIDGGLFFCLEDLVAITDIGRDTLFPVLADTEGKVVEMYVEVHTKKVPKDFTHRLFFGEFFGNADKVVQKSRIAWRNMIFVLTSDMLPTACILTIRESTDIIHLINKRLQS